MSDVAALYLSRALVEAMSGWPLADELQRRSEDRASLNPRMREFLSTLPQVLSAKAGPGAGAALGAAVDVTRRLLDATRARRVVTMRYFSASKQRAKHYDVHPTARARERRRISRRLGAGLRRVPHVRREPDREADRQEETFRRTRELPENLFGESMGVFWGEPERIEIEFEARVAPFVRGRVWHESQELAELPGGRLRMVLHVSNDWALRSWLLGFGAGVRVVAPTRLADAILDEFKRACGLYEPGLAFDPPAPTPADQTPPLPLDIRRTGVE